MQSLAYQLSVMLQQFQGLEQYQTEIQGVHEATSYFQQYCQPTNDMEVKHFLVYGYITRMSKEI